MVSCNLLVGNTYEAKKYAADIGWAGDQYNINKSLEEDYHTLLIVDCRG